MAAALKVLVIGPAWVGDMVMAQSLYQLLKQREPNAVIDVLAPAWSLPLLVRMPEVRRGIELPLGHGELGLAARYRLGKQLRPEKYERAIVLPRSMKAALIPFFARARQRSGYRGELRYGLINDMRPLDKTRLQKTVERYLALGMAADEPLPPASIPSPALRTDKENLARLLPRLGLTANGAVALLPGAEYGPAKQWPLAHWAALARRLQQAGRPVWLLGSHKDHASAQQIIEQVGGGGQLHNLCGKTELADALDLLSVCRAAVSNDSGLMHVAAAVGIPLVGLYGSSTPDYTPPLSERAVVIYHRLACSPCFKRHCPLGHGDCLQGISVDEVWGQLVTQLSTGEPG